MKQSKPDLRLIRQKSLQELEGPAWADPDYPSSLVQRVRALGSVPIGKLGPEDLRLVIGQRRGLRYLVPVALDLLEADPLRGGNLYPGDLLMALARAPDAFWAEHPGSRSRLQQLLKVAQSRLEAVPDYDAWNTDLSQLDPPSAIDRDSLLPRIRELLARLT